MLLPIGPRRDFLRRRQRSDIAEVDLENIATNHYKIILVLCYL
jgi:hypothetical protein